MAKPKTRTAKPNFTGKLYITLHGEYGVMEQSDHLVDCMNDYDIPGCPGQFIVSEASAFEPKYVLQFVNDEDFESETVDPYGEGYVSSNPPSIDRKKVQAWLQDYFADYESKIKVSVSFKG